MMKRMSLLLLLLSIVSSARAQTCPVSLSADLVNRDQAWQYRQNVKVYLADAFPSGCASKFAQSMSLWQGSSANVFEVTMSFTNDPDASTVRVYHRNDPTSPTSTGTFRTYADDEAEGLRDAALYINPLSTNCDAIAQTFAHELGHGFGLNDCYNCSNTVMRGATSYNDTSGSLGPTACDSNVIVTQWEPLLTVEQGGWYCIIGTCPVGTHLDEFACACLKFSPIVIDLDDGKYELSGADDPVSFDLSADGMPDVITWTGRDRRLALLALDRNGNGTIDNGAELFGNFTPDAAGDTALNGFEALRVFDLNQDDNIDRADAVWERLLLWIDGNHDGVSQPAELSPIAHSDVERLGLFYVEIGKKDRDGNLFTYKGWFDRRDEKGRLKSDHYYDVFFRPAASRRG